MGLSSRLLRLPRPRKFLYTMSLSTGASLITLSLLLNKLSGVYGILAVFTGYHLSPFQLSMYIYSLVAIILTIYLTPHIRTQSPLHCLALAWFYCLDSIINAAYTAAFAVTWFLVLAQHNAGKNPADTSAPGAGTIDDTSGFTNPQHNVSSVEIVPPAPSSSSGGKINAVPASSPAGANDPNTTNLSTTVLSTESMNSIGLIIFLWTIRLYFCVIMLAFARLVLRNHIYNSTSQTTTTDYTAAPVSSELADNPFSKTKPEGQGWKGRLGRILIAVAPKYFLGAEQDESWMQGVNGKFRKSTENGIPLVKVDGTGTNERERRRRSGTGPPEPNVQTLAQAQALQGADPKVLTVPSSDV